MNETGDVLDRLTTQFDHLAELREAAAQDPILKAARRRLRAWQAARLHRTYADLLADPSMDLATTFFLTDIYGAEDLAKLDANVRRIAPAMKQILSVESLQIVADAIELEALSEDLDFAMTKAIEAKSEALSAPVYAAAYREVDRRADRMRQIGLIKDLGDSLDRLVHTRFVGATLSLMRKPAQLAGLGEVNGFLQRGYDAFAKMGNPRNFLDSIVGRERKLVAALFSGDEGLLGM